MSMIKHVHMICWRRVFLMRKSIWKLLKKCQSTPKPDLSSTEFAEYFKLFGRLCWMCNNTRTLERAHQFAFRIADPHKFYPLSQWVFVPIWGSIGPVVWPSMLDMWCRAHVCARINAHSGSPTPYLYHIVPRIVCAHFQPDRPSRLAAYTGQDRTGQNVTETISEKYNIDI
jgi:hypothetical protein